jgi:translation elongation factor EF-4
MCHVTGAEPERVIREIEEIIGLDCSNIIRASAKMGLGIEDTLEAIVQRVPPPKNTVTVSNPRGPHVQYVSNTVIDVNKAIVNTSRSSSAAHEAGSMGDGS